MNETINLGDQMRNISFLTIPYRYSHTYSRIIVAKQMPDTY